jgi:hypothetical protein
MTALFSLLFVGFLSIQAAETHSSVDLTIRVEARNHLLACHQLNYEDAVESHGFIYVPPKASVSFVSAMETRWTHSCLEKILHQLDTGVRTNVDVGRLFGFFNAQSGNIEQKLGAVVTNMAARGITAIPVQCGPQWEDDTRELVLSFFKNYLQPQYLVWTLAGMPASFPIDIKHDSDAAKLGWPRVVAFNAAVEDLSDGYKVTGSGKPGETRFPAPSIDRGALILRQYDPSGVPYQLEPSNAPGVAFFAPGHSWTNPFSFPCWVRLGMNDDLPQDNGTGEAIVTVRLTLSPTK